jgi:hypothetical protein
MQESHDRKRDAHGRESDATSKATLEDLEKSEKISDSKSEHESDDSEIPSPDGSNDETRRQSDDAGPM